MFMFVLGAISFFQHFSGHLKVCKVDFKTEAVSADRLRSYCSHWLDTVPESHVQGTQALAHWRISG